MSLVNKTMEYVHVVMYNNESYVFANLAAAKDALYAFLDDWCRSRQIGQQGRRVYIEDLDEHDDWMCMDDFDLENNIIIIMTYAKVKPRETFVSLDDLHKEHLE